jgi:hypothetical protein
MSGPLDFDVDDAPDAGRPGRPTPPAPAPGTRPGGRDGSPGSRYLWVVGAGALVLVAVLVLATLNHGTGRGARGVPAGQVMPPFAVPLARSDLEGDANIATKAGEGAAGAVAACSVRGPRVLNGCALRERGPVVLAFFATRGRNCVAQLDALERVRARVPAVQFAAVAIRGARDGIRALIREHRWTFPVGYDRDGALAEAYHVQVCPQITFARRGGRVQETTFGTLDDVALAGKARRLVDR